MPELILQQPAALLWLAIVAPIFAGLYLLNFRGRVKARHQYGERRLIERFSPPLARRSETAGLTRWLLIAALLAVTFAQPMSSGLPTTVNAGSLQVVALIDVSVSMATEAYRSDVTAIRPRNGAFGHNLDMAKSLLVRLVDEIGGNEMGVITFRGDGIPRWELTGDLNSARWIITHWLEIGEAPGDGSNYAAGLRRAIEMFERSQSVGMERTIILFADGGYTGSEAELDQVVSDLTRRGIHLVVVALGPSRSMRIPTYDQYNRANGWLTIKDEVQWVSVDESRLRSLAQRAGGEYVRIIPGESNDIPWANLLTTRTSSIRLRPVFQYLVAAAALFIAAPYLVSATARLRKSRLAPVKSLNWAALASAALFAGVRDRTVRAPGRKMQE